MRQPVTTVLSVLAACLGVWILFNFYGSLIGLGQHGDTLVPDLVGKSVKDAERLLQKNALTFSVSRSDYNATIAKDTIISQDPDSGMRVKKGRPVQVVVSNGPEESSVPDLRGLDLRESGIQLENNKLKIGKITYATHPVAKKNVVIDQDPIAGKNAQPGSNVDVVVSIGPAPAFSMPQIAGQDLVQAKTMLQDAKLRIGQVGWRIEPSHAAGEVLTQNPDPGAKVHEGDMVSLVVSAGEKNETLPFKQSYITVLLPPFDGEQEVSVWVTDETSTNLAYRAIHHGREKIELMVSGYGNSKVEVYLGDKILTSGKL